MFLDNHLFSPVTSILDAVHASQATAASNIANAQTPGYTAKSTAFEDALRSAANPFETNLSVKFGHGLVDTTTQDTGKPVNMQQELVQMQKNLLLYNMASRRLSSVITAIRTASQVGR